MKKLILFLSAITYTSLSYSQNLTGKIVFSHFNKSMQTDSIFAMTNSGATISFVTEGYRPRLSHDGTHMAFTNGPLPNQSYNGNLYMRDLIAQHDTFIVGNSYNYLDYYDFTPGDNRLAYSQGCSIYTTNIDGSDSYSVICNCGCFSDDPTVRVSDSLLVYHNLYSPLYTMNMDGSNNVPIPHTYAGDLYPIWSPDGQWVSYLKADSTATFLNNLYKIKFDGSDSTELSFFSLSDSIAPDPLWASDMQSIYVIARVNDVLGFYRVNADGSGTHTLMKEWSGGGSVYDFWLGLADSVSSNPASVPSVSLSHPEFFMAPNPASSQTTLRVSLEKPSDITIEVFDMMGKKMKTIFSGNLSAGNHSVLLDVHPFLPGNYFVRMKTVESLQQRKLIVLH